MTSPLENRQGFSEHFGTSKISPSRSAIEIVIGAKTLDRILRNGWMSGSIEDLRRCSVSSFDVIDLATGEKVGI